MRIAVIGAGALGSTFAGTLAAAGAEVWLVGRAGPHVDAIARGGLCLVEAGGERVVRLRAQAGANGIGTVDLVVVLVKSYDTEAAIADAAPLIGPTTTVMSLQNGLGHEDLLAAAAGRERVIAGKTYAGGVLLEPGRVLAGVPGKRTVIGELDGADSARVRAIAEMFGRAGLATDVSTDIVVTMWDKLLVNVATGALGGITRLPYGALYAVPEIETCALAAVTEAMAVARARGVRLATVAPEEAWRMASAGLPGSFKTSMLQSLERGEPTEIDFINGAVVRHGEACGVPTPVNRALVACIKGIERAQAMAPRA